MKMTIRMMKLGIYGSSHNSEDSCFAQYHNSFCISAEIMETSGITQSITVMGLPVGTLISFPIGLSFYFTGSHTATGTLEISMHS